MSGPNRRVSQRAGLAFAVILALAPAAQAGVNTWTGGSPSTPPPAHDPFLPDETLIATDPRDPYVVYAVFQPHLYKSRDGGRSWEHLASFLSIRSLLVHPAAPDTLYMGVMEGTEEEVEYAGVVKSADGGLTWERKPFIPAVLNFAPAGALAGSPTDADTVYAATGVAVFKSTDGGGSWTRTDDLSTTIASLVVSPRDPQVVYAGTEADSYYFHFGTFARSSDGGSTWSEEPLGDLVRVGAIAVEPAADSALYLGLSSPSNDLAQHGIRRSVDGGQTFLSTDHGLPLGANVTSLAIDPAHPSTLYAGTDSGVYRSRDSGANWWAIGQVLAGHTVDSLAVYSDGRRIHAGTASGAFDLDFVSGPVDVAATPGGGAHVLRWNSDRLAVQTVDGSNNWTATPFSDTSPTWTGVAIAAAADGTAQVLWQNGDGRSALETVGAAVSVFGKSPSGISADVAVGADGSTRRLVSNAAGAMHIMTIRSDGAVRQGPEYGPTPGWSAVAVDVDAQGRSWVLWRSMDGRAAVSLHVDGTLMTTVKWGATEGWWVEDLAVAADGRARVLARTVSGSMQVWTVGEDGSRSLGSTYESPGLVPRRIAAGADGLTRVLWGGDHGEGAVWFLTNSGNSVTVDVPVLP